MGSNGLLTKTTGSVLLALTSASFLIAIFLDHKSSALVVQKYSQKSSVNIPKKIALIYSRDPNDPWNAIFHLLFTREFRTHLSNDFHAGPFMETGLMGLPDLKVSTQTAERLEIGDRAIDPLYPSFFTDEGVTPILSESHFYEFTQALTSLLAEQTPRPVVARALMQMDLWAAYDILFRHGGSVSAKNQQALLTLLAQCVHKLALTDGELSQITGNYLPRGAEKLPDLLNPNSGWLEIQLMPNRLHDLSVHLRRVARVFILPGREPSVRKSFVESLKFNKHTGEIAATALIIQSLVIDRDGRVKAVPLITDVQMRVFPPHPAEQAQVKEFELSREKLVADPQSTGFVSEDEYAFSYVAAAGNDYGFATPLAKSNAPALVQLRTRCAECHGRSQTGFMTFAVHDFIETPPVRILDSRGSDRVDYVSSEKEKSSDFKSLISRW